MQLCMHAVLATVNSRSKSNDIINEGGSVLYSRLSRGSRYLAHELLLLIHQTHLLDNLTLRYVQRILSGMVCVRKILDRSIFHVYPGRGSWTDLDA